MGTWHIADLFFSQQRFKAVIKILTVICMLLSARADTAEPIKTVAFQSLIIHPTIVRRQNQLTR